MKNHPMRYDWIAEFKERATPGLRDLFTADRDFTVLPDIIANALKRLALAEQQAHQLAS